MKTTVKQRLKEYILYKGISMRLFERTCGLSHGYVSYNVEARMGLISLYDTGKAEVIGDFLIILLQE